MQNHYNNGMNFKDQMCQIFTYFVEKGMVALEDDEAVCIPEKIRLSMLNLTMSPSDPTQPIIAGGKKVCERSVIIIESK